MSRAIPILATFGLLAAACGKSEPGTGPPGIVYGEATCARCGMILKDPRFAGALRLPEPGGGTHVVVFDDIGELFLTLVKPGAPAPSEIWVHDAVSEKWIDGRRAVYVHGAIQSPMGLGLEAHADRATALRRAGEVKGEAMDFESLKGLPRAAVSTNSRRPMKGSSS
jgi:nitrous oxide reductase accessory protein NosL